METTIGTQKNIVVLGAGYGGLRTALRLETLMQPLLDHRITLVDQNRHHQIITLIHEVAGGRTPAEAVALPFDWLLGLRRIDFHRARVTGLDLNGKAVLTDHGALPYDQLVIALGSETNFYGIPGMREHSFTLKSLGDACLIQGHLHEMLAWAASQTDPQARREALNFVVGGGGFTGVELAGELAESLPRLASGYGLSPEDPKVIIVEAAKALLPGLDAGLVEKATRSLQKRGIEMLLGSPAQSADARGVTLVSGERIDSRTLIWAGGVRAVETLERWGLPVGAAGRVKVDDFLGVEGLPGIYAVGDSALVIDEKSQRPSPPSAQLAVAQAETVARNIHARITGRRIEVYRAHVTGEAVSLGAGDGVAWVGPARFSGNPAQWLKAFIARRYLWETGGFELVRTHAALAKETVRQDFPQCLPEFRPGMVPTGTVSR